MEEMQVSGVLFDLDGVLIDSTPAVKRVWARWAAQHGFDADDVVHRAHGRPSISTIRELLPDSDLEAENRLVEQAEIEDVAGIEPLPGVMELLSSLPQDRWAIVTSCTRDLAAVRIAVAGLPRPTKIITSTDISHGKPHPEPYQKGAEELGVFPPECVVFEDAPAGILSGKTAGSKVVALRTTMPDDVLLSANPDWLVDDCSEIVVAALNGKLHLRRR